MTLDEAIKHCEEVADRCEYEASRYDMTDAYESHMACKEGECGEEHRQLAKWLKELRAYRKMYHKEHEDDCLRVESEPQESDTVKRKEWPHKPCINYEDGCEEWAGCPCVHYKAESEETE